jgi:nucleoside-triphosphatase THEP1
MDDQGLKFFVTAPFGEGKTKLIKRLLAALEHQKPPVPVAGYLSENIVVADSTLEETGASSGPTPARTSVSVTDLISKGKQVLSSRAVISPFAGSYLYDDYHVNVEAITSLVIPSFQGREASGVLLLDELNPMMGSPEFEQALQTVLDSPHHVVATLAGRHEKLESIRKHPAAVVIGLTHDTLPDLTDTLTQALAARQQFAALDAWRRRRVRQLVRWYLGRGQFRSCGALFEVVRHIDEPGRQPSRADSAAWVFPGEPGARVVADPSGELGCGCPQARGLSSLAEERQECAHVQTIRLLGDELPGRWSGLLAGGEGEGVLGSPGGRGAVGLRGHAGQPQEDGAALVVEDDFLIAAVAQGRWGAEATRLSLERASGLLGARRPAGQELRGRLFALFHSINEALHDLALSAPGAPTPEASLLVVALDRRHHRLHYARFGDLGLVISPPGSPEPLVLMPPENPSRLGFLSALASRSRGGDLVLDDPQNQARDSYVGVAAGLQEGVLPLAAGSSVLLSTSGLGAVLAWNDGLASGVTDRRRAPAPRLASLLDLALSRQSEKKRAESVAAVLLDA